MQRVVTAKLVILTAMLASGPAGADWVPRFQGNDTGGIIAHSLAMEVDARQIASVHCAKYGKVAKFLAVDPQEGGYISFACRWVPYGAVERPLITKY